MVKALALAENFFVGDGVGLPTGGDMALSDRGFSATVGGVTAPFCFSDGCCCCCCCIFVILLLFRCRVFLLQPLSSGGVASGCVISTDNDGGFACQIRWVMYCRAVAGHW